MATIPNINLPEILSNEDLDNIINEPVVVEQAPAATPAPETAPAQTAPASTTPVPQRMSVASAYRKDAERYARQAADSYQDMLNAHREALMKERTDNAKMARFAALGNALTSMVQPLGWAIGGGGLGRGATGGYQPYDNREYISAFNRAIQAGQDLRNVNLKDAEFQYKTLQQREASARRMAEIEARTEAQIEAARLRAGGLYGTSDHKSKYYDYVNRATSKKITPMTYQQYIALTESGFDPNAAVEQAPTPVSHLGFQQTSTGNGGKRTGTQTATPTETKTEEKKPEPGFWDRRRAAKWGEEADLNGDGRVSAAEAKAAKKKQKEEEEAKRQSAIKESSEKKTTPTQSATKASAESTARKTAVQPKDSVGTTDAAAKKWDGKKRK